MPSALEYRNATQCENATTPPARCRCRCGGKAHGAARGRPVEDLPDDDPHHAKRPGDAAAAQLRELFDD